MNASCPRWVVVLGQWLLCGGCGGLLCWMAALVFVGRDYPPALWGLPLHGFCWGLIGGGLAGLGGWLYERLRQGLRPGETILAALGMCLAAVLGMWGSQFRWGHVFAVPGAPWGVLSGHVRPYYMAAWGAGAGALAAALVWGWPKEPRRRAVRNAAVAVLLTAATAYVLWPEWSPFAQGARALAYQASCMSNQKSLGLHLLVYANDYGDRLPPGRTSLELLGLDRAKYDRALADPLTDPLLTALGGGPMYGYSKNVQIWFCPADTTRRDWRGRLIRTTDPEPGVSYLWHASLAGRKVSTIPVPGDEWLLRDREPWHNGTRVLVFADGRAKPGNP